MVAAYGWGVDGLRTRYAFTANTAADYGVDTSYAYLYDPSGNVAERMELLTNHDPQQTDGLYVQVRDYQVYDAFGTLSGRMDTDTYPMVAMDLDPVGFGGQYGYYTDTETGLVLLGARYYDPSTGRFLNRDPIGYDGGINLYGFCGNNPVNESDPEGTSTGDDIADIGSLIPGLGEFIDGGHAIYFASQGDWGQAALYGLSAIPAAHELGDLVKGGKFIYRGAKFIERYKVLAKVADRIGQAHHLLQDAAFGRIIPHAQGATINLIGSVFRKVPSEHRIAHQVMEAFWDQFRAGGAKFGRVPLIGEYVGALRKSLVKAGLNANEVGAAIYAAKKQLSQFGLHLRDEVPRIPGRINGL